MKVKLSVTIIAFSFLGCASSTNQGVPLASSRAVVDRADDLKERPSWAELSKPGFEENGKRYFLGYVEFEGDVSKSAALNMSDEKAISEPFRSIVDQFLDQNQVAEELRGSTGQRVISTTRGSRPQLVDLQIVKRYWELVETRLSDGTLKLNLRAYSLAEIPKSEMERAKSKYLTALEKNSQVQKILDEVGAKQREAVAEMKVGQ